MLPFFRILSYSFFSETGSWVSDRFINEFMSVASSLNKERYLTTSALLCTSSYFPNPCGPWKWNGKPVYLQQNKRAVMPSFMELDSRKFTIEKALSQMSRSMLVDIVNQENGEILLKGYCVADVAKDRNIDIVATDDMIKRLLEKR